MAWCRPGDKPLSDPMMFNLLTHICDTRPQWVKHSHKCPTQIGNTHKHGGPSEAGDCSHPPPKMATVENLTLGETAFDHVAGHGSLRFLACKHVSGRANLWCRNVRSLCIRIA